MEYGEDAVSVDLSLTNFVVAVVLLCFVCFFFFTSVRISEDLNGISPRFHVVN